MDPDGDIDAFPPWHATVPVANPCIASSPARTSTHITAACQPLSSENGV